ncbi:MAG TPA: tetratricopeptide repeat protein [Terriglobales bacterium]|nr:tetratricopeptide repeat protein [Terriglobales bacterium]
MKRAAIAGAMLAFAVSSFAQYNNQSTGQTQNPPPAQKSAPPQGAAGQGQAGAAAPAQPQAKRPPQAKTQPEYDAYQAAVGNTDPAALEKAANDFAAKFPDSELRIVLYKTATRAYQGANNADKTAELGRKVLALDPDDPEALVMVANVLAERTRDTDLDKDQRLDEAMKMAQHANQTIDTDIAVPPGTPPDKLEAYKALLRSNAYSIIGTLEFNQGKYPAAEADLRKSIDVFPQQPDPVVVLRLALALDKQGRYPDALKEANRAVDMTPENSTVGGLARKERDRLVQLNGGTPPPGSKSPSGASGSNTPPAAPSQVKPN